MSTNHRCSCKTLKHSQCAFKARASEKYCGHHEPCKRPMKTKPSAVKTSTNRKPSSKKSVELSKQILQLDADMKVSEAYYKMVDDPKLWKTKFTRLFQLLIKLRELDRDLFSDTNGKLTLPFQDIGYGEGATDSEDHVLYNDLFTRT